MIKKPLPLMIAIVICCFIYNNITIASEIKFDGWKEAKWGMTYDQVKTIYNLEHLTKNNLGNSSYTSLYEKRVTINNIKFSVLFGFNSEKKLIWVIMISAKAIKNTTEENQLIKIATIQTWQDLQKKYGNPEIYRNEYIALRWKDAKGFMEYEAYLTRFVSFMSFVYCQKGNYTRKDQGEIYED